MPIEAPLAVIMECLMANELGGDLSLAHVFSDPDGLRTGKSGYSFGRVQFDLENNWLAFHCLEACGFSPKNIKRLFTQDSDISDLNAKLKKAAGKLDEYDIQHVHEAMNHCRAIIEDSGVKLVGASAFIHIVDYHNQLFLSEGGKLYQFLSAAVSIDGAGILQFKLAHTKWGAQRPDDVRRRWSNIERIVREHKLDEVKP